MPRAIWLLLLTLSLGCGAKRPDDRLLAGQLEAKWTDSGRAVLLRAPAEAHWCARDTMLEVLAVHNDTGIGLALFARDSARAEGYPLFPAALFAPGRPQATAGVRLATATDILGYESGSGLITLTEGGSTRVSGNFAIHLKRRDGADSLHLTGSFLQLPIRPAAASCGRALKPATP